MRNDGVIDSVTGLLCTYNVNSIAFLDFCKDSKHGLTRFVFGALAITGNFGQFASMPFKLATL